MPDFYEVFRTRRSIRRFSTQSIPKETILELLDLCRYAANAHNNQPFRYIVILNQAVKSDLIAAMSSQYKADLKRDGIPEPNIQKVIGTSSKRFLTAPVLILACLTMENMDQYPDLERQNCELTMGIQSVANTLQNLLLLAHARGLGASWYCAPLFCPETVKSVLKLPESYIPQAFITIGIPDETPPPLKRMSIEELVQFLE